MAFLYLRSAAVTGLTVLGACTANVPERPVPASLDPVLFFLGRTHGDAELHKLFSHSVRVEVDGLGRTRNSALVLDQTTREGDRPARARQWVIEQVGPNRYRGTLTDATGPVSITVHEGTANIEYEMSGGLSVKQRLTLQSGGRTILNRLKVTKFGIPVATLRETIHKLD